MARHDSNTIIKFADDTTVVGLITDNDETAYREEVRDLAGWCQTWPGGVHTTSISLTNRCLYVASILLYPRYCI
jgi:hypothetical protein